MARAPHAARPASEVAAPHYPVVARVGPEAIAGFGEVIDVRSPAEYAEDHVPGAVNFPVLTTRSARKSARCMRKPSAFDAKRPARR